ncbi:unnamed protein product [Schistocephalus solidus]|uniref:Uncharacterized protein n=1 Tax=Schistocephalus solidus TaxID=70667 RepID=A0A183TF04_SCHSO|nr:unnamed protein product [Schistocephalus solidus]
MLIQGQSRRTLKKKKKKKKKKKRSPGEVYWLSDVTSSCFVYPSSEAGESCSHLPLYATVLIAPGLSTLAVCCVPLVSPVSSPVPVVCSATLDCVGRGIPLRLGSPWSSSHRLTPCDTASAGVSLWRGLPPSSSAAEIVGCPGCFMP